MKTAKEYYNNIVHDIPFPVKKKKEPSERHNNRQEIEKKPEYTGPKPDNEKIKKIFNG